MENRAGARGFVAADFVAKSAPTGQTLLLATSEIPLRPVQKDLQPVGMIAKAPVILVANPKVGRSVKEFVANAANQPVASGTLSSSVALSRLEKSTGVKFSNRVAFAGSAPALTSILAGQVVGGFVPSTSGVLSAIRSGSLVALGITSRERSPLMPDVPTLSEQGFADVFYEQWFGLLAPAGTPRDVVDALNRALVSAVSTNEVRERFTMIGVVASPSSPGDFVNSVNQTAGVPICGTPCPDQCKDGCGDSDCCVDRY